MSKRLSLVVISALILAGCGGGDDDASAEGAPSSSEQSPTTDAPPPTDAPSEDEPTDEGDAIVEEPSADDSAMTDADSGDDVTFVGDSDSNWCIAARDVDAASDKFDLLGFGDPEAVEAGMGEMRGAFEFALPFAPPELAADVEVSFASYQRIDAALEAVDYDFLNADLSVLDDVDGTIKAANDRIGQYNEQVCGIPVDDDQAVSDDTTLGEDDDGSDFDLADGTIREQMVTELVTEGFTADEAECIIDKIDFTDPESLGDTNAIVAVFTACEISLERLAELAG